MTTLLSVWLDYSAMLKFIPYYIYVLLLGVQTSMVVHAQHVDSLRQVDIAGEASVTAWRNRSPLRGSSVGRIHWEMKRLQTLPQILGNADPLRYVQSLPTVQTSTEYDAGLHVQGCDMGQNAFMMGGATVFNPSHLLGIFSAFNASHFETLDFTALAGAAQPNRLGGVVQMRPFAIKNGGADSLAQRERKVEGAELNVGPMSSQGTIRVRPNGKLLFVASARQAYMNLLYGKWLDFDGSPLRYSFGDYNVTLSYRPSMRHRFDLNAYFGQDRASYTEGAHLMHVRLNWLNYAAEASWRVMNKSWQLTQRLVTSGYQNDFRLRQAGQKMSLPSHIRQYGYQAEWSCNSWQIGGSYSLYQILPQSPQIESTYTQIEADRQEKGVAHEANVYAGWQYDWHDGQWVLKPEGRVTYYRDVDQKNWFSISPMLTLSWQAAPQHRLGVQLSVANQYVQQTGFTSLGLPTEFWFSASRELKPQRAEGLSLLYDGQTPNNAWAFTANAYVKRLHHQKEYKDNVLDLINEAYSLNTSLLQGRGLNYGFGVQLTRQSGPVTGWVGYAFGRSLRKFPELRERSSYPANHERVHELNLVATWQALKRVTFTCSAVFASGTPFTSANEFYLMNGYVVAQYGKHNGCHLPWYKRVDMAVNVDLKQKRQRHFRHGFNVSLFNAFGFNNPLFYRLRIRRDGNFRFAPVCFLKYPLPSFSYYIKY